MKMRSIVKRALLIGCLCVAGGGYAGDAGNGLAAALTPSGESGLAATTAATVANTSQSAVAMTVAMPVAGGSASSSTLKNGGCAWTFTCTGRPSWITALSVSIGNGNVVNLGTGTTKIIWTGAGAVSVYAAANTTGAARSWTLPITVSNAVAYTIAFSQKASASVTLSSVAVSGASSVTSGNAATYACTATYSDGSTETVTPTWTVSSSTYAAITSGGVLTAKTVSKSQSVTVTASYAYGGVTKTAKKTVTIQPGKTLKSVSVSGVASVTSGKTATYACTAAYSDGTSATVTPTWTVSAATYAAITSGGVLTAKTVSKSQSVTVTASYAYGGVTKTAKKTVTISPSTVTLTVTVPASGGSATASSLTNDGNAWTFTCAGRPSWITALSVSIGNGNVMSLGSGTTKITWTGSGTVSVYAAANTTGSARSWTLPITTSGGTTYQITFSQKAAKAKAAATATVASAASGLPVWAYGDFTGYVTDGVRGGLATLSVSDAGKISGKVSLCGTNWSFSAASYASGDSEAGFAVSATAKTGDAELPLALTVVSATNGVAPSLGTASGTLGDGVSVVLYRNVWTDAGMSSVLAPYVGCYTMALTDENDGTRGYLTFTVDDAGAVKVSGVLADGTAVSQSGMLVLDDSDRLWTVIYVAQTAQIYERLLDQLTGTGR